MTTRQRDHDKRRADIGGGAEIAYLEDDCTDGWARPETVLLLHGIAENGVVWRPWIPHLARRFNVISVDLRGFGASSPLPGSDAGENRKFVEIERLADDMEALVGRLGRKHVHLVGAKLGALVGVELAQRQLPWVTTLTLAGMLASPKRVIGDWWNNEWTRYLAENGVEAWARLTMPGRMGTALSAEAMEWWAKQMGKESVQSVAACMFMVEHRDEPRGLDRIICPTLVMTAGGDEVSRAYSQRQSVEAMDRLQSRIRNAEFQPLPGANSYHIAATHPDVCASKACEFMTRHSASEKRPHAAHA